MKKLLVKICGMREQHALDCAAALGVDFCGFIFAPESPRAISPEAAAGLDSLPRTLREAITVAGQSEFISRELPVALMNKYFESQTQLCHDAEGAPDTESWERAHSFLII